MKKLVVWSFLIVGLTGCGLMTQQKNPFDTENQLAKEQLAKVRIGEKELMVELNTSGERKNRGGVTYVYPPGVDGVLYDLGGETIAAFNAELLESGADYIWIGKEPWREGWMVVGINKEVKPGIDEDTGMERVYGIDRPAYYMLEVHRGFVWDNGVRIADTVEMELPVVVPDEEVVDDADADMPIVEEERGQEEYTDENGE